MDAQADGAVADARPLDARSTDARLDAAGVDAGQADLGVQDTGPADVGGADVGGADVGGADAAPTDVGGADVGGLDVGGEDVGGEDVGGVDAGGVDAGGVDTGVEPADAALPDAGTDPTPDAGADACPGPGAEVCNALDDDCDGAVDEALGCVCLPGGVQDCYGGPVGTAGVGVCRAGLQVCRPDGLMFEPCAGAVMPTEEVCNGLDDDCDGVADDVAALGSLCEVGVGACRVRGVFFCGPEGLQCGARAGDPFPETCNDTDDDCDGHTDEGLDLGLVCEVGVGRCRALGVIVCGEGDGPVCSALPGAPMEETCEGSDEDCDGAVDELLGLGMPCEVGVGACVRAGELTCTAEGGTACGAEPGAPAPEACGGRDEDCDGRVDEGLGLGDRCAVGRGACVRPGIQFCDANQEVACDAVAGPPQDEVCEGTDEDCDGAVDEGFGLGAPCEVGVGRCARAGVSVCQAGRGDGCDAVPGEPSPETCDDTDEDCDGLIDEDFGLRSPCVTGLGACERVGEQVCLDGGVACDGSPGAPEVETCNDRDDDCDGQVDEDHGVGRPCRAGVGACVRWAPLVCAGEDAVQCSAQAGPPAIEHCNKIDDDCDGAVDERLDCLYVEAHSNWTCARLPTGRVKCWGSNFRGALGIGDNLDRGDVPGEMGLALPYVQLGAGRRVARLGGGNQSCVLLDDRSLKCWGDNMSGRLGLEDTVIRGDGPNEMGDALPAVRLGAGRHAVQVQSSLTHTCALLDDATVKCWGTNSLGRIGLGEVPAWGYLPGHMGDNLPAVDLGAGRRAIQVAVGGHHVCALLEEGELKCWGRNDHGQLGLGDAEHRGDGPGEMGDALPVVDLGTHRRCIQVSASTFHTCALLDDGSVKCWGRNVNAALGVGHLEDYVGDEPDEMGDALEPVRLGTGRRARVVSAGGSFTCALLDDGALKCWGANLDGQLGLGDQATRGATHQTMGDALPAVNLGTNRSALSISTGGAHSCAVLDNATVKCWGGGFEGRLGLGNVANRGDQPGEMGDNLPAVQIE